MKGEAGLLWVLGPILFCFSSWRRLAWRSRCRWASVRHARFDLVASPAWVSAMLMSGGRCLPLAGCGWRLAVVISSSAALWRTEPREIGFIAGTSTPINSSGSRIRRRFSGLFSACETTEVVANGQRTGGNPVVDWEGAQPRRILRTGYDALWLPAGSMDPSYSQAEGRPFYFLPAMKPKGRQPAFCSSSAARCRGGSAVPSGDVPGDDEAALEWEQYWTQLQSSSAFRGPLCISQGPACNFLFPRGLAVRCFVLQCFE